MRFINNARLRVGAQAAALTLFLPVAAHAYVDPTAGSVLFQAIAAGVLAGIFTLRLWWNSLWSTARGLWARLTRR